MTNVQSIEHYIRNIPKAELHLHIEGSFEPGLMFAIAKRNNIKIPYTSVAELKSAYNFHNLQEFLDIYYAGAKVLQNEQDFYDLTWAYLLKAQQQNIWHTEIFFDPQTHTTRGINFATIINGIHQALVDGEKKLNISSKLILCFLRHLSEEDALRTFTAALPYKNWLTAVGLDSSEAGNPPEKFQKVFAKARTEGLLAVAHAGEEGPAQYIWQALNLLKVSRIDHGNHAIDDKKLIQELIAKQIPLTMCPLSNYKLQVTPDLSKNPLKPMLDRGLLVTINSDDPAYFGGYINENYFALQKAQNLTVQDIYNLAVNSFKASFLEENKKQEILKKLQQFNPTQ